MVSILNTIDKNFLEEHRDKFGWKGSGSEKNPIIIDKDENLPQNIVMKTDNLFIHVKDIDRATLVLEKCQNVTIEDCIITLIKLYKCRNIEIRNNLIREIQIFFGKSIKIENNRLFSYLNLRYFTAILIVSASLSALLFFLSYPFNFYILREMSFFVLISCLILFFIEMKKKHGKFFLNRNFQNNEFLELKKE
ncbi:MAG: hypothetical protein EU539_12380 [Promethearchaeota archaeon]|nr:MAG: hypothetical protein EU539_12380 [Candidatus Lokiarchaeota archaeon]